MLGHRRVHLRSSPASLFGGRLAHTQFLLGSSLTVVMTEYRCGSGSTLYAALDVSRLCSTRVPPPHLRSGAATFRFAPTSEHCFLRF
ncbi:hypothetical protein I4F81_001252 [Pyropia yezoensis]|uniref:Uncharacterized protein n=1 Tax=Pyropia yezoensis TaxID=2788 RepID=A0ACC3BME2_PYRYE|nr:hypothetical protein I4F81_001252 [Neopyropia yezoensis]